MKLFLINHDMRYAAEQILLTLFPGERPEYPDGAPSGERCEIALHEGEKRYTAVCRLVTKAGEFTRRATAGKNNITDELTKMRLLQKAVKLAFYRAAIASGVEKPIWGSLTGIRPGKLMSAFLEAGLSDSAALFHFQNDYDTDLSRAKLCLNTAHAALDCAASIEKQDICLYVGIPFCPTRCSYCSFVSSATKRSLALIPAYLEALYREIEVTGEIVHDAELRVISLYLGGGTPTTLSAKQTDELFSRLESAFDFSALREITVEAGRPDTITAEKLHVLKTHGVSRVSVNPQTMEDAVLAAIGRKHTAKDVLDAVALVREAGGFEINMDLIAGLPLDTPETFERTLKTVIDINPENITIHTLALKKGSEIMRTDTNRPTAEQVSDMLNFAEKALTNSDFAPYYLYRQKYMSGGFENVGWQRGGSGNIYNICIMEELCSIISLGGGASTKLCLKNERIERVFNPKYPHEYIDSIERIIEKKLIVKELLK